MFKSPQERMITYIRLKNEEVWGDLETVKKEEEEEEEPHGKPRNEKITSEIQNCIGYINNRFDTQK